MVQRQGRHYSRKAWTLMHRCRLADLRFEQATHHAVHVLTSKLIQ